MMCKKLIEEIVLLPSAFKKYDAENVIKINSNKRKKYVIFNGSILNKKFNPIYPRNQTCGFMMSSIYKSFF